MKTSILIAIAACLGLWTGACHTDNEPAQPVLLTPGKAYSGQGEIVRAEYLACMCCGGYWLKTEQADSVLFGSVPDSGGFTFAPNDSFPIPVEYRFFVDSSVCWQVRRLVTMQSLKKL